MTAREELAAWADGEGFAVVQDRFTGAGPFVLHDDPRTLMVDTVLAYLASPLSARHDAEVKVAAIEEAATVMVAGGSAPGINVTRWHSQMEAYALGKTNSLASVLNLAAAIRRTATPEGGK